MDLARNIEMKTSLPGPRSAEVIRRKESVIPNALSLHVPAVIAHAWGALVTDLDGNRMIDLTGGLGVLNVGHAHPKVTEAIQSQAGLFLHTDFSVIPYESFVTLAERLTALAPGSHPKKVAFFNAGVEAVENAVKIARAYTKRRGIIAFEGGFHGRTLLGMTLTSRANPYKTGFGPFAPEVYRVPFPNPYRPGLEVQPGQTLAGAYAAKLEDFLRTQVDASEIAAVIVEPVQGEGGFVIPPDGFLQQVQDICRRHGILLIVDEIQTGFGRTGKMFASEWFGIEPDLMCVAKSLAAGMPLSAVIGRQDVMDAPPDSSIGGTYVGNPVACQAALAVLDIFAEENLLARANAVGERFVQGFQKLAEKYPVIGDVRGLGAMVAVEFVKDRATREPDRDIVGRLMALAMQRGVLTVRAGTYGNVLRLLNPLVITDSQIDEALEVLDGCLAELT